MIKSQERRNILSGETRLLLAVLFLARGESLVSNVNAPLIEREQISDEAKRWILSDACIDMCIHAGISWKWLLQVGPMQAMKFYKLMTEGEGYE